jgi:hypothetical protein
LKYNANLTGLQWIPRFVSRETNGTRNRRGFHVKHCASGAIHILMGSLWSDGSRAV